MDILGSSLSHLRYKDLNSLDLKEKESLEREFSTLMWNEVLKSLEKCDESLKSEFSRSTDNQLTSLQYQMLAQKMGDQFPLDFSSIFGKENMDQETLNELSDIRLQSLPVASKPSPEIIDKRTFSNDNSQLRTSIQADKLPSSSLESDLGHTPTSDVSQKSPISFDTPEQFIENLLPIIRKINPDEKSVPSEAVLAQAALETGWGKKILGHSESKPSFNLFNIKATKRSWGGAKIVKDAIEVLDGKIEKVKSAFRSYSDFHESVKDYFKFISGERYNAVFKKPNTPDQFIDHIASQGYATDPKYTDKINNITRRITEYLRHGVRL